MIETIPLLPGVTLRCFPDSRFKQEFLSIQFLRPLCREEAALNALIPAVLLRGTVTAPDLRSITLRLDDLYGASVGAVVRKVGDYQATGLCCSFIADPFTLEGEALLEPMVDFLRELLWEPATQDGVFRKDYVESEKKNLICTIESQKNDKRVYAVTRLLQHMCRQDPFGVPRLGQTSEVSAITSETLYRHYQTILRESPVELFYVGQQDSQTVAQLFTPLFSNRVCTCQPMPAQTPFQSADPDRLEETLDVSQGKLCMGFVTPVTLRDSDFAAMQVCNTVLGAGMTSKLFMEIREKASLCYDIGSSYYGSKGILIVSSGIDFDKEPQVRQKILNQVDACARGQITQEELTCAKESLLSGLSGIHDSPGAIEGYYATGYLGGITPDVAQYMQDVQAVTVSDVARVAKDLRLHTVYFLKGES